MAKVKVPKKVAGVKIPKKVRKQAKQAVRLAENPMVRDAAVAALGALAEKKFARPARTANDDDRTVAQPVRIDADRLASSLRSAALNGIQRFLDGFEEGLREREERRDDRGGKTARKARSAGDPD